MNGASPIPPEKLPQGEIIPEARADSPQRNTDGQKTKAKKLPQDVYHRMRAIQSANGKSWPLAADVCI
jgi:hypothetical protein